MYCKLGNTASYVTHRFALYAPRKNYSTYWAMSDKFLSFKLGWAKVTKLPENRTCLNKKYVCLQYIDWVLIWYMIACRSIVLIEVAYITEWTNYNITTINIAFHTKNKLHTWWTVSIAFIWTYSHWISPSIENRSWTSVGPNPQRKDDKERMPSSLGGKK